MNKITGLSSYRPFVFLFKPVMHTQKHAHSYRRAHTHLNPTALQYVFYLKTEQSTESKAPETVFSFIIVPPVEF